MPVNTSPVNITYPNTARFVIEFFDSDGDLTVPSSGTLTISYVDRSTLFSTSTDIALTQTNSFFLGTWSSTGATIGLATWSVSAPGITSPAAVGQIRVIYGDGN
mgnify:CR=1 FL=1